MPYLRVDCGVCGNHWNYYDERYEPCSQSTAVNTQGCVCPNCGNMGWIQATENNQTISEKGNDIYLVRNGDREWPIPATHEVVREIDLESGTMTICPLEGMLDLNEV